MTNDDSMPKFVTPHGSRNPIFRFLTRRFRQRLLGIVKSLSLHNESVMEVGCGEGFLIRDLLAELSHLSITGVDLNVQRVELVKALSPEVSVVNADAKGLPFVDNACDLLISNEMLEHVHEPELALRELARITGKFALLSVPNEPIFSYSNLLRGAYINRLGRTPGHVNAWSRKGFRLFLAQEYEIVYTQSCFPWTIALCRIR